MTEVCSDTGTGRKSSVGFSLNITHGDNEQHNPPTASLESSSVCGVVCQGISIHIKHEILDID